jgi:hypothetical protein
MDEARTTRRSAAEWALVVAVVFLALGGLYGGAAMLLDPSGGSLGMASVLPRLPVSDFTLPGVFLAVVMGLAPLAVAYGLVRRPPLVWAPAIERQTGHTWAWTGALGLGVVLALWLALQGALIGFRWPIQYVTAGNAALIIVLALVPSVRGAHRRSVPA